MNRNGNSDVAIGLAVNMMAALHAQKRPAVSLKIFANSFPETDFIPQFPKAYQLRRLEVLKRQPTNSLQPLHKDSAEVLQMFRPVSRSPGLQALPPKIRLLPLRERLLLTS